MDEASAATWRFDRATTPWLRVVSYVVFGAFGGLLVTGLLARLRLVQRGQPLQAFVLLVALLAGPAVLLGGLRYARQFGDRSHGTDGTEGGEPAFRWRWVGVAALLQGTVAYALVSVGGTVGVAAIAGLFLLAFGGAFALNRLSTEGAVDPGAGTLRVGEPDGSIDLGAVRRARTVRIGLGALAWLTYESGVYGFADPDTRRLVVVNREAAAVLKDSLRRADRDDERRDP